MSTAVLHGYPLVSGRAVAAMPHARLRLTRRGRAVRAAVVALPLTIAAGAFVLGGGSAVATGADTNASSGAVSFVYVQVEPGQSLWEIASTVAPNADPRDVVSEIVNLNGLVTSDVQPGQELAIPAQYEN